ncbi:gliding motility-associated C-terminal domain-containing protein [Dyadobacter sp. CY261]|uniref:gliding motility-associated C-terminal domain-containing protein n=1 Tax=Dyadobacter sp. CY261 TaxID=2907203 RepID=UPI001F1F8F77|nr:gliding motility-associated C-terminal domain-containing protein [Dyadobacter sp. CY261]MCF0069899.1 gliding motility-associated C-terminal domain-containing protein [Dyadobacter sp. CY261]
MLKDLRFRFLLFSLLIWFTPLTYANHIVGGELQMKPGGLTGQFEISLIQFWDQNNLIIPTPTVAGNRDTQATLYIYQKSNNSYKASVTLKYLSTDEITYQNRACASSRSLKTVIGYYKGNIYLDPSEYNDPAGYFIVWERCCRNDDINNIEDPGDNGMVFYLEFPPLSLIDSSPEFVAPNGQYICANRPFSMNMSATDADRDELRYSLVTPMRGNTNPNQATGTQSPKSSYPLVSWVSGVSLSNVIPGSSPLRISASGILTLNTNVLGLYVFTVQCEEFRNGKRIGVVRRDFQLLVIDCNDDQPEPPVIKQDGQQISEVSFCPESLVELTTDSSTDWSYQWQLNGLNIPGATGASVTVKDSGNYTVIKSYTKKCSRDTTSSVVHATYTEPEMAVISSNKSVLCVNDSIVLLANGGAADVQQKLTWRNGSIELEEKGASLTVRETGIYILEVDDELPGCAGKDTMEISREEFSVTLPEKKGIPEGGKDSVSPFLTPDLPSYSFAWSPPDGILSGTDEKVALISPVQPKQLYNLRVTSLNGCVAEDSVLVYLVKRMYIPTSFTPNSDGHNDTFEIFNASDQIEQIRIYNRWGELIFQSTGYSQPWDGTYQNSPVSAGSYPYVIKTAGHEITGTVLLLK